MYLGQVAVWQGLTFATEGLRLRHAPDLAWSEDILFETDPEKTFALLGYGPLPEIRTRHDLWRYVMSSPRALPGIFAIPSLNARNRTRNSHRPLWVAFQEWLLAQTPGSPACPPPRVTWAQAYQKFSMQYPILKQECVAQGERWRKSKEDNHLLGIGAVEYHDPMVEDDEAGPVVRKLQEYLPDKAERKKIMSSEGPERDALITLARQKAGEILAEQRRTP
jgi:hypothetical protein